MRRWMGMLGVLALLAGTAQAQGLLVAADNPDGTTTYKMIQVNYLDLRALTAALGGQFLDLSPGNWGRGAGSYGRTGYPYGRDPYGRDGNNGDPYNRDPYNRDPNYRDPRDPYNRDPRDPANRPYPDPRDLPPGTDPATPTTPLTRGVDPNAPLAPFIPEGIISILGIER